MEMLTLSNVQKRFGEKQVLDNLSFSVGEHRIFGFVGQNGAGKTTTMKLILGLLQPDGGEIFVNGKKVYNGQNSTNRYIGYLPDVPEFYGYMTAREYLFLCGRITGMDKAKIESRSDWLLSEVGLSDAKKRISGFSRGMKQRLGIAQALLNRPKLLICDEPTSALDPVGRREVLRVLAAAREHTSVLFSTHILSDVERICDDIAFLHDGRLALQGTMKEIKAARGGTNLELEFCSEGDAADFSTVYHGDVKVKENRVVCGGRTKQDVVDIMHVLSEKKIPLRKLELLEPTLEDLFMEVVRK